MRYTDVAVAKPKAPAPKKSATALLNPGTSAAPTGIAQRIAAAVHQVSSSAPTAVKHATTAPPRGLTTSDNPRGVAIITPAQHDTPNDTAARIVAKLGNHSDTQHAINSNSGLLDTLGTAGLAAITGHPTGAIRALIDSTPLLGKLVNHSESDVLGAGPSLLTGLEELVPSIWDDVKHGRLGVGGHDIGGGQSKSAQIIKRAYDASATHDLLTGNIKGALDKFVAHPVYTATELYGDLGIPGRVAGAAGRSGLLGKAASDFASTARADRTLLPELPAAKDHYSKNLATKWLVQKQLEKHPTTYAQIRGLKGQGVERLLNQRVDKFVEHHTAVHRHREEELAKQLRADMPEGAAAGAVPHMAMGTLGTTEKAVEEAKLRIQELQAARARHEEALAPDATPDQLRSRMSPGALKTNLQHEALLQDFVDAGPGAAGKARAAADAYRARQEAMEAQLHRLNLQEPTQTERRTWLPLAQTHLGAFKLTGRGIPTEAAAAAQQAARELEQARKAWKEAEHEAAVATPERHAAAERELSIAKEHRDLAEAKVQRAEGFVTGRYGQARAIGAEDARTLPAVAADRLTATGLNRDTAAEAFAQRREAIRAAIGADKEHGSLNVAAHKANYERLKAEFDAVHKPVIKDRYTGHVIPHEDADAIRVGKYRGQRLRPVSTQEIKDFAHTEGIPNPAYVSLRGGRDPAAHFVSRAMGRGGKTGKYTGTGLQAGAWEPGYGALSHSQMLTQRRINQAEMHDDFIKSITIKRPDGRLFGKHEVEHIAQQYEAAHGVPVTPVAAHPVGLTAVQHAKVADLQEAGKLDEAANLSAQYSLESRIGVSPDVERYVLAPTSALHRYEQHLGLRPAIPKTKMNLGGANPLGSTIRAFRNSTLPYSTKWITGNITELGGVRGPLVYGNPITGAMRARLVTRALKTMEDLGLHDEAQRLRNLTLSGTHFGLQHADNLQAIGARAQKEGVAALAQSAVHINEKWAQVIFAGNRKIESFFERGMLGQHMHNQLVEWSGSWLKATFAEQKFMEQLARGYADPKLAEDATNFIHDNAGKYNSLSPSAKYIVSRISPYAPWSANAYKFIYYTMPVKHPVTTSVLLNVQKANAAAWAASHQDAQTLSDKSGSSIGGVSFGSLLTDVKLADGGFRDFGRYTPFGVMSDGPVNTGIGLVFPEFQGAIQALRGQDPFGGPLVNPPGGGPVTDGEKILLALSSIVESLGGPISQAHRVVAGHGATAYNTTPVWDWNPPTKPGSEHHGGGVLGGLNRVFNPFNPTYLRPASDTGGTGSSGGNSSEPTGSSEGTGGSSSEPMGSSGG